VKGKNRSCLAALSAPLNETRTSKEKGTARRTRVCFDFKHSDCYAFILLRGEGGGATALTRIQSKNMKREKHEKKIDV
jgi:hypothetical protein